VTYERVWTARFADGDPFGVAHYPRIVDAVHETSDAFMQAVGWPFWELPREHGVGLPVAEADFEFESPVEPGDEVAIELTPAPGDRSVRFDLVARLDDEVVFSAFEQRVCVDSESGEPRELPAALRSALAERAEE